MILTGKTIPQLPQLSAATNTSIIPVHLLGATYYSTIQDLLKSNPFGTFYQNLIPSTSNTLSIGSSTYKLSSITVNNIISTAITTTLINTNSVPTKGGTFAMLGDVTGNTVGGGSEIFISASSANSTFRSLSSSTPDNLTLTTSGDLILFSGKTFITGGTNNGSGANIYQSASTTDLAFRTLSSSTPTNLNIVASGNEIVFSSKTFITGATNLDSGSGIFKSADTQTLSFRSLSSSTPNSLTINTNNDNILFNVRQKYYGSFQDVFTQSATTNNVGVPMLFRTIDFANGISIVSGTSGYSRITFTGAGIYNLQFSSQFENNDNSERIVNIWLRRQGNDVAGSSGRITIHRTQGPSNPGTSLPAWNYLLNITGSSDYYEIIWSTDSAANVFMKYYPAGNPPPGTASVIVTIVEV